MKPVSLGVRRLAAAFCAEACFGARPEQAPALQSGSKLPHSITALLLLAVLGAAYPANQAKDDRAEVALQAAIKKEAIDGDLKGAIEQYKKIAQSGNRAVAAKALVRMGQCYEKLGDAEARKAYESVIRQYGDQSGAVAEARARLAALGQPGKGQPSGMTARRVWVGDFEGKPSPDGRFLTFVDWDTGDLAVRDLLTGQNRRLTKKGSWFESNEFALLSAVSPDGKQVAYTWFNKENLWDLRVLPLDASPENAKPRILSRNTDYIQPVEWSPEGKRILSLLTRKDGTGQAVFVSLADGSVQVVKTTPAGPGVEGISLSPDGRYIVYDYPPKEGLPERDIFLLSADGSREIPLVQHPANDLRPVWTPDGSRLVFLSDRTGTMDLWTIQVRDGKPFGTPELVKRDIGPAYPRGFTRNGSLYYGLITNTQDVYLAALDLAMGKLTSPPAAASHRYVGSNYAPDWSPDGQYLAYVSQRYGPFGRRSSFIVVRSLETGEERELPPKVNMGALPHVRWSPDGRSFAVFGGDTNRGIYRVDVQTGQVTPIVQTEPGVVTRFPEWSPDGKTIFYLAREQKHQRLVRRDLETGRESELYRAAPDGVSKLAVSPDGRWLAFGVRDRATRSGVLMLLPALGGEARELIRVAEHEASGFYPPVWTRDGRELVTVQAQGSNPEAGSLMWRVDVESGARRKSELPVRNMRSISFHPDGRRIAFQAGEYASEVWVMENFLPKLSASR